MQAMHTYFTNGIFFMVVNCKNIAQSDKNFAGNGSFHFRENLYRQDMVGSQNSIDANLQTYRHAQDLMHPPSQEIRAICCSTC